MHKQHRRGSKSNTVGSLEAVGSMVTDSAAVLKLTVKSVVGKGEQQPSLGILCGNQKQGHRILLKGRAKSAKRHVKEEE